MRVLDGYTVADLIRPGYRIPALLVQWPPAVIISPPQGA
ncbi:MAG: hypothetical protein JWO64_2853 [Hyphomicrobiales bacterium]|jgi:hypothetical protein|nr:hypothetical protein [Hyphomicrobiales bacterium]